MLRHSTLALALFFVGCANQGDESMFVRNNTAVTGTSCSLSGDPGQPFLSHGQIFAGSPLGYTLTPLIQSRISGTGVDEEVVDPLQKTIQLRSADVSLTLKAVSIESGGNYMVTQPESNVGQFSVLFSGALPPNGSVNVGFEVITPAIMRSIVQTAAAPAGAALNAEVLAEVTVRGDLGGNEVVSTPFFYPISVCNDCVVFNLGACPVMDDPRLGNACNPYQDGVIDCCTDANGGLVCPALVATAAQ